ncbi:class I adenylate-forming enzyme family protein [Agrobacterium tumefaciens]|uniref:class I adenylate-forming enzyme family protein n=1 Tax=Agrobacterium tumefaciens TaxID=358 RepID=UPI002243F7F7|nr:AMP-binding protein [Agrobacterium tumefaciens]MCW8060103.1 AMP-binding protein [Agrobacterium tumefaciens]
MRLVEGHNCNVFTTIEEKASRYSWRSRTAFYVDGQSYSFDDVFSQSRCTAAKLVQIGVNRNDRVLLELPDSLEFVTSFLGAMYIGATPIPLNPELHPDERCELIARANARLLLSLSPPPNATLPYLHPDDLRDENLASIAPDPEFCSLNDVAYGIFSSGTTGLPKIIYHSNADAVLITSVFGGHLGIGPTDVSCSAARMCFAAGLGNSLLFPLLRGGAAVLYKDRPSAKNALADAVYPPTIMYGPPSFYAQVLDEGLGPCLARLRVGVCGGAVLPLQLEIRLREFLEDRLVNIFGSSEIGHAMVVNGPGHQALGATGRVLDPYRARVVDAAGSSLPAGCEGRLEINGPTIAIGVERGSVTPVRISQNDWYATGDVASIDADGFVFVSGRVDDIEIVGGQNVHPAEIESTLLELEDVKEVAVFSSIQPDGRPLLKAAVVPTSNVPNPEVLLERIKAHALKKLSWFKVPQALEIVTHIPLTTFGKVDRKAIKRRERERLSQDGRSEAHVR